MKNKSLHKKSGYQYGTISITIYTAKVNPAIQFIRKNLITIIVAFLSVISIACFVFYYENGLGLAYNDARSHLDIGRRVVEGLKTGLAQLGSVWLPLPHLLMVPTVWIDFFWHSGLSGAIQSMISFVITGVLVYLFLRRLKVSIPARIFGVFLFVANINILYLQSTAMTELLLIATMTAGVFELLRWEKDEKLVHLIYSALWIMLSTLIRYDGWFLLMYVAGVIALISLFRHGWKSVEGRLFLFITLGGLGVVMWLIWNMLIFSDPLYFALGPYSARAQQEQLESAGELYTKGQVFLSFKTYFYALAYNSNALIVVFSFIGAALLVLDRTITWTRKLALSALFAPFIFNILALYLGHSVLFVEGIVGETWFNVRYGILLAPFVAIMGGYLVQRLKLISPAIVGIILFVTLFTFLNNDAVTIDDARFGSSQKNVKEVSGWLASNTANEEGFILISAASHDAIIFSSGLPMKRFIHEGTGSYWESATEAPDRWARWIIMRTHDNADLTFREIRDIEYDRYYNLVGKYPFADIYELKDEYIPNLHVNPVE